MPRNPDAKRKLLKAIHDLKFATIYNLAFESAGQSKDSYLVSEAAISANLKRSG